AVPLARVDGMAAFDLDRVVLTFDFAPAFVDVGRVVSPSLDLSFSESELMQNRSPVGVAGASSKTWPRCAPQRWHITSIRGADSLLSIARSMARARIGCQKLGQPVPESNLLFDENSSASQQAQTNVPLKWPVAYRPENGGSVALSRVTSNTPRGSV